MEWAQICSVLNPTPSPNPALPHPCLGSPGVKWRHLEGDNLSAACAQGPNDLMAHRVCGASVEKTKRGPPTLRASAPFPWATELLGPFAREPWGKGMQSPGIPGARGLTPCSVDPPVGDSLQGAAVAAGQPERTVSEDVGTVGDAQDQQIPPSCL